MSEFPAGRCTGKVSREAMKTSRKGMSGSPQRVGKGLKNRSAGGIVVIWLCGSQGTRHLWSSGAVQKFVVVKMLSGGHGVKERSGEAREETK